MRLGSFKRIGNGIETAMREWIAAPQAPQRQPRAAARTVRANSLRGVARTRRMEFAGRNHQRREHALVGANRAQQNSRSPVGTAQRGVVRGCGGGFFGEFRSAACSSFPKSASSGSNGNSATERRG